MIVKYLFNDLRYDAECRKLACIGIGKKFEEIYSHLRKHGLEGKVSVLADNDKEKQGKLKALGERQYTICSVEELVQRKEELIYIISSADYQSVLEQLNGCRLPEYRICYLGIFILQNDRIERMEYIIDSNQKLLTCGLNGKKGKNIGDFGENLTISILSCNRSELTIKLLQSIETHMPDFQGEILIGDNGSEEEELQKLRKKTDAVLMDCSLAAFGKNLGVGNGRNRLAAMAKHEWIFQIDNDMSFIRNPLKKFQDDIALLGCHFMGTPYYDRKSKRVCSCGGYLEAGLLETDEILLRHRYLDFQYERACEKSEWEPVLCTYASGGAVIFKKETFLRMGGYERNMFVGYEDIELALRIFKEGYKVGNAGTVCLVHDHQNACTQEALSYERVRNSLTEIRNSVDVLEKKHGVRIWTQEERAEKSKLCGTGNKETI